MYTPPTDTVTVEIDGPTTMLDECFNLTQSTTGCSFNITVGGVYTMMLIATNVIGATSNVYTFNCKCVIYAMYFQRCSEHILLVPLITSSIVGYITLFININNM